MTDSRPMGEYEEMVTALRETLRGGRSGTLYITTADNHSGMFGIDKGKIVSVSYHRFKGQEALPAIRAITAVRTRFSTLATGPMDGVALPSTDAIMAFLSGSGAAATAPAKPAAPPAQPARPPASSPAPSPASVQRPLNAPPPKPAVQPRPAAPARTPPSTPNERLPVGLVKQVIIDEATEYLGPMAPHVCEEHFALIPPLSPAALLKVVDAIAAEVETAQRDKFRARVLRQVDTLLG